MQTVIRQDVIERDMLQDLPEPVQRYLVHTGVIGKPWINTVNLKYTGEFRLAADKAWMPMRAVQTYTTNPPGFQWKADFKLFGLPLMRARDTYKDGQAHMFGKLAGLIPIFDTQGKELLQGAMVRYLQEMVWFPTAYLSDYITWKAVDDHTAEVSFTYKGEHVKGCMYFDDDGRVVNFMAERYREHQGDYTLDTWATPITGYDTFNGLQLPVTGRGVWQLPEGDLSYIQLRVRDVKYNIPTPTLSSHYRDA